MDFEFKKEIIDFGKSLPNAKVYWRNDWQLLYFDLAGHFFALMNQKYLTFKNLPSTNLELREIYPFIIPGFHVNKKHWNSILLDKAQGKISLIELQGLLKGSYKCVYNQLPKKTKLQFLSSSKKEPK
ncbi:conserved protein of unknown function [Oenococcus oeni]|uniref:MmcQ/YjbR family DNA-binding protein n=1 Tax=Oenococcus oeni TaxID=1247 RepID=UPI00107D3E85|nr:MmcQ/YjbR family DNA-binding protein [Oenococcus oeni]AVI93635.1 hypothetical protein AX764_01580 [Oenococcus oeni]SYV98859.1 conserved hypothetical protein [Oenococcus oeni]SYW01033.1 conserved hypothetical protein [Oenococcus oeni]SYW03403.1 conserved hypothetical protein [Oenococcus oeni]SYW13946.1 conserved hypothetical protein [Oenococcus oeni]